MDLFATRGLIQTLRTASHDAVVPVRVVRHPEQPAVADLRPANAPSAPPAVRSDVVVHLSPDARRLAGARADAPPPVRSTHHEPPARGGRLDVLA